MKASSTGHLATTTDTARLNMLSSGRDVLVYRHIPHKPNQLVFSAEARAYYVHQIWAAIKQAKTWGQFIDLLPPHAWQELRVLMAMDGAIPGREVAFNAEVLPGYTDGDYPPWLQTEMAKCIPANLLTEFGVRQSSSINGSFWEILAESESRLVDRLRQLGYVVELKSDWIFW